MEESFQEVEKGDKEKQEEKTNYKIQEVRTSVGRNSRKEEHREEENLEKESIRPLK